LDRASGRGVANPATYESLVENFPGIGSVAGATWISNFTAPQWQKDSIMAQVRISMTT
jgi:hypothetical protein